VTSKQFLGFFGLGFVTIATIIILINLYLDVYGLFRPTRGRDLGIYGEERVAKYLHSYRYIPESFDGVLLGSSVSDNLDTRDFAGYRIYNASINGGNVEDLEPIAENIFRHGELKLTIICVHRYLTNDHVRKTELMESKELWGAFGSPQLMTAYISLLATHYGVVPETYDERGTLHLGNDPDSNTVRRNIDVAVDEIRRGTTSVGDYHIDPLALTELEGLITNARRHSRQLVVFYPPIPAPILAVSSAELGRYRETINGLTEPNDVVVDFNNPKYESIRTDYRNFVDAVHLSKAGATVVESELSKVVSRLGGVKTARLHR
jgi:hypothetical protein